MNKHPLLACLLTAALAPACADEDVDPAPADSSGGVTTFTTPTPAGQGGGGGEGGGTAPVIVRTVEQRSPFGNVAAKDNLLWDGDFEWSSPFSDQYGWLSGPPFSYAFPPATIGAECRSGVKCATIPKNKSLIGIGVGSGQSALVATVFAKPKNGVCADVEVLLFGLFASGAEAPDIPVPPTTEAPDAAGWCLYRGAAESYPQKAYLYIDNNTGDPLVVDNAVVRAVPKDEVAPPPPPPPAAPPTAGQLARRDEAREATLRLRGPYLPPPNAAKRAFQEHLAR